MEGIDELTSADVSPLHKLPARHGHSNAEYGARGAIVNRLAEMLHARYPLLTRVGLQTNSPSCHNTAEPMPLFFGFMLAAMQSMPEQPLCFVLPRKGEAARLAAVLFGMLQFQSTFSQRAVAYAARKFSIGQSVRVHPSQHVFRFAGPAGPGKIWLQTDDGKRWFSAGDALRLEATQRKTPKGRLNTPIANPAPAALDLLLNTATYGNQALFQNEVILLDSQTGFKEFAESTFFLPLAGSIETPPVKDVIPLGTLRRPDAGESWFRGLDREIAFEPLVAVTHSAELLADYCLSIDPRSKVIVVNDISRMKDMQSFDDVMQLQPLVLFADSKDKELLDDFEQRGCVSWWLNDKEMMIESAPSAVHGPVSQISRWAFNKAHLEMHGIPCASPYLDQVWIHLESLRAEIQNADDSPLTRVVKRAWRCLCELSQFLLPLSNDDALRLLEQAKLVRSDTQQNSAWLSPSTAEVLGSIADELERCIGGTLQIGTAKGDALLHAIGEEAARGSRVLIVTRSDKQMAQVEQLLVEHNCYHQADRRLLRHLSEQDDFDLIIACSWFGAEPMRALVSHLIAPRFSVLAYSFEQRWLGQLRYRVRAASTSFTCGPVEKLRIVGHGTMPLTSWPGDVSVDSGTRPHQEQSVDVWEFERQLRAARKGGSSTVVSVVDSVEARYVSFVGESYAFLTDSHKLPVATGLLSRSPSQVLPERRIGDIGLGDFVVFPESGARELIQEMADRLLGRDAESLRGIARMWKDALQRSGMSPDEFLQQARQLGQPRHIATIRNWFADTSQIGPGNSDEELQNGLELVALATDSEALQANLPRVIDAVHRLRSAHNSAGSRLRDILIQRLPAVIASLEETGTQIDLDELGSAWIVQVESIGTAAEPRPKSEVNCLLWDREPSEPGLLG